MNKLKGKIKLDNRWVVPYSPYLLKRFNCHINVERTFDIQSVKYLYKYVYKGQARADIEVTEPKSIIHDEVKKFVDGRYISAPDGCWKIFRLPIQEKSHSIVHLPVHLEGKEVVYWEEGMDEDKIREAMEKKKMLEAFLNLNNPQHKIMTNALLTFIIIRFLNILSGTLVNGNGV
jgi:hypothetical protein